MKKKSNQNYTCCYCGNEWSLEEGFNVLTNQCFNCQRHDDEKELRCKEFEERQKLSASIDFIYTAGDPFW